MSAAFLRSVASKAALAALLFLCVRGCAAGLDFDSLSNECELPRFDIPGSDTYCSGVLSEPLTFVDTFNTIEGSTRTYHTLAAVDGGLVAISRSSIPSDATEPCTVDTVDVTQFTVDGSEIESVTSVNGSEFGALYIMEPDAPLFCAEAVNAIAGTTVDILFWLTHGRSAVVETDPLRVIAPLGAGGAVYYEMEPGGTEVTRANLAVGVNHLFASRECDERFRYCISPEGGVCYRHGDCLNDDYCGPLAGTNRCQPMPESRVGCVAAGLRWDGGIADTGQCRIRCGSSADCPGSLACDDEVCGGTAAACLAPGSCSAGFECLQGRCLEVCQPLESGGACRDNRSCYESCEPGTLGCEAPEAVADVGVCASSSAYGPCDEDDACALGQVADIAAAPDLDVGGSEIDAFALALVWDGLGIGFAGPDGTVYLQESTGACELLHSRRACTPDEVESSVVTSVVYDAHDTTLWAAVSDFGVVAIDLTGTEDSLLDSSRFERYETGATLLRPISHLELLRTDAGAFLVAFEGGYLPILFTGEPTRTFARIFRLPSEGGALEQVAEIELDTAVYPTVGVHPGDEDIWLFGFDREGGVDFRIYDMSFLRTRGATDGQQLASTVAMESDGAESRAWIIENGIYSLDASGITRRLVEVTR